MTKRIVIRALLAWLCAGVVLAGDDLAAGFHEPPADARPWVYSFWLNGNITKEGITADLEAMKRAGIGGLILMEVDQGTPQGPVKFMSAEWRALFKHLVSEAARLGLEINMNNDAGWNGSGGPWVPLDKAMQIVVTSETRVKGGQKFEGVLSLPFNKGFYRDIAVLAFPAPASSPEIINLPAKSVSWTYISGYSTDTDREAKIPVDGIIPRESVLDLTSKMDADGKLIWSAPAAKGDWLVVRFGHTFTGAKSHPAPASGEGPECDKMSKEAIELHFNGMIGKLIQDTGPLAGRTFAATHVDSWEVGAGNWTPRMREEFKRLRGYDMTPFLPVLTGRFVGSVDITERFLWDLRQTASDLLEVNYVGHLAKLAHDCGLRLSMEAYGTPALDMDVINHVDEPVCEFWWSGGGRLDWTMKAMSSAAHVNGRPIVGAEAFTSNRRERWQGHPAVIKARGDRIFTEGVTRFIVHRYAMQPWAKDVKPGISMGPYGLHYERTQTWWEYSKAWHQYLARCQYLLRQGKFVADVLSLHPEEPMQRFNLLKLAGYDYDGISPKAFIDKVTVENGQLTLPSGMKYRLLVLSSTNTKNMSLPMLKKIRQLVDDGAVILGEPPEATPGLEDYPKADAELKKLAAELWGTGGTAGERAVGKGKVFRGMKPEEVLAKMDIDRDFSSDSDLRWIHRRTDAADIYFVALSAAQSVRAVCTFRVQGRQPELWNPDSGEQRDLPEFAVTNGCTAVPLEFEPNGSMFVVFREKSRKSEVRSQNGKKNFQELKTLMEIGGPWDVSFAAKCGAPEKVTFEKLVSWSQHADPGIKYFSGTGAYRKVFTLPNADRRLPTEKASSKKSEIGNLRSKMYLDLGKVAVMADVTLNGKEQGILWKPPYLVEVTDAVKTGGNVLEIRVVNLWINRLIGDEFLPEDSERNGDGTLKQWPSWLTEGKSSPSGRFTFTSWRLWKKDSPLVESGLLGPVTIKAAATPGLSE